MKVFDSLPKFDERVAYLMQAIRPERTLGPPLDIQVIRASWLHHSEIEEFAAISSKVPMTFVRVLRSSGPNGECGYAYRPDEYSLTGGKLLITLDEDALPSHLSLPEALLHEMAHYYSVGCPHDWSFLLALNIMRVECGYKPTEDVEDCGDLAYQHPGVPANELLERGAQAAADLRQQFNFEDAVELTRTSRCPVDDRP